MAIHGGARAEAPPTGAQLEGPLIEAPTRTDQHCPITSTPTRGRRAQFAAVVKTQPVPRNQWKQQQHEATVASRANVRFPSASNGLCASNFAALLLVTGNP